MMKHPFRFGKEHYAVILVAAYTVGFEFTELVELCLVCRCEPAGLKKVYGLKAALGAVFMLEPVEYYFKLEKADGADYLAPALRH